MCRRELRPTGLEHYAGLGGGLCLLRAQCVERRGLTSFATERTGKSRGPYVRSPWNSPGAKSRPALLEICSHLRHLASGAEWPGADIVASSAAAPSLPRPNWLRDVREPPWRGLQS